MKTVTIFVFAVLIFCMAAQGQIPRILSYQGVLTDNLGVPKPDGSYSLTFRLYDALSSGTVLWTEAKTLQVTKGLFSTILGDQTVIPDTVIFDQPYWLSIQVAAEPELSPRIPLTAVGYSFSSMRAETSMVSMKAETSMVSLVSVGDTLWRLSGSDIYRMDGNVGIGTNTPARTLDVNGPVHAKDSIIIGSPTQDGRIVVYKNGSPNPIVNTGNYLNHGGSVIITDELGNNVGRFRPSGQGTGGAIEVYRNAAGNSGFYAGGNNYGDEEGYVAVFGSIRHATLYMGATTPNSTVQLPDSSISSEEILDEPGIASIYDGAATTIANTGVTNITSASITVPGPGFVVARASGEVRFTGSTIGDIMMGITTSATATPNPFVRVGCADEVLSASTSRFYAMYSERTFAVSSSGTNTYYMNANRGSTGATATAFYNKLTLTYYPTNYGSVTSAVPLTEAQKFESATPIEMPSDASGGAVSTEKMYKVDLSELVLKAAKARAAAEKAERELMEAKMNEQNGSVNPDNR